MAPSSQAGVADEWIIRTLSVEFWPQVQKTFLSVCRNISEIGKGDGDGCHISVSQQRCKVACVAWGEYISIQDPQSSLSLTCLETCLKPVI